VVNTSSEEKDGADGSATTPAHKRGGAVDLAGRYGWVVDEYLPSIVIGKAIGIFALPIGLWAMALVLAGRAALPDYLSGLVIHGPYLLLTGGLLLSLAFRQGRAFFVLLSLTLAYFVFVFVLERATADLVSRTAYAGMCVFVPLNIAVYALLRERGVLNAPGLRRLSLPLIEAGTMVAIVLAGADEFTGLLYQPIIDGASIPGIQIPQWGIVFTIAAVVICTTCAVSRSSVIDAAFAAAAASFALACNGLPSAGIYLWFCTIAGMIVAVAVVQDSHRLAFYDELTGLPGRRALNERLGSLDGGFTLAMADIDHFKAFNDTWGHDVGDQVLKLVAVRLQRVGGGGTAFRYGGEEFVIVFPGQRAIGVVPHLEVLRKSIESYQLMLRESRRSPSPGSGPATPAAHSVRKWISITISIGVAERADRLDPPEAVLAAADKALYRAKTSGRNRVSR
jgi:diguanylate cyclase (GGDEF)-like protein